MREDVKDLLHRAADWYQPPAIEPDELARRLDRERRRGRFVAAAVAIAVFAAAGSLTWTAFHSSNGVGPGGAERATDVTASVNGVTVMYPSSWTLVDLWPLARSIASWPEPLGSAIDVPEGTPERGGLPLLQLSNQDLGLQSVCGVDLTGTEAVLYVALNGGPYRVNADGSPIWSHELSRDDGPCGRGWYAYKESSEPGADGTTLTTPYLVFAGFGSEVTQTDRDAMFDAFSSLTFAPFDRLRPPAETSPSYVVPSSSPSPETTAPETVSVSRTLERTPRIRCTASLPSDVEPGAPLGLVFTLENISSSPVDVTTSGPSFSLLVTAGDGTTWDLRALMAHSEPYVPPTKLRPGESATAHPGAPLNVQFPGPLTITPTCAGEQMDPLHVTVAEVGPSVSDTDAVERARAATSGLLEDCDPPPNGSAIGTIGPPADPSTVVSAACAASVSRYAGFSVVTFAIGIPADADGPRPPSGLLGVVPVPGVPPNTETAVWRFVVTASRVVPVASATSYRSTANGDTMTTEYEVSTEGWKVGGASRCGAGGSAMGGDGSSVTIVLLSACERSS